MKMVRTKSRGEFSLNKLHLRRPLDRLYLPVALSVLFIITGCVSASGTKQKLANTSACCNDLAGLPYAQLEFEKSVSFDIDEKSPVFQFPTTRSYFRAFALPPADSSYSVILKSHLTNFEPSVLMSRVYCPVVMLLDANYKIRADYLRPLVFNKVEETPRSIPLTIPLTPQDRFLVVHTEDVLIDKILALDLGRDSPTIELPIGSHLLKIPKRPFADPGADYRIGHSVPCVYTGKLDVTLSKK